MPYDQYGNFIPEGYTPIAAPSMMTPAQRFNLQGQPGFDQNASMAQQPPVNAISGAPMPMAADVLPTTGSLAGIVPYAGAALGGLLAYQGLKGLKDGKNPGILPRAQAAITTGGLSEVARMTGLLGRKSTKDIQKGNTKAFQNMAANDPAWQAYLQGARAQQMAGGPPDKDNPFSDTKGNKYKSWEDYKKGGLDAANLTHVAGNIQTFGPEWGKYSEDQRKKVTQALIDNDLYYSKKGEVNISDKNKARELAKSALAAPPPQQQQRRR